MPTSYFESAVNSLPVESDFDKAFNDEVENQKIATNISVEQGIQKNPARQVEVMNMANRSRLPADVVDRNLDVLKQKEKKSEYDFDSISKSNPALAEWLLDPNHVAISQNDLEPLKAIESNSRMIAKNKVKPFQFTGELTDAASTGFHDLKAGAVATALAYGVVPEDSKKDFYASIADSAKRAREIRSFAPDYVKKSEAEVDVKSKELNAAKEGLNKSFDDAREGMTFEVLQKIASGTIDTMGEAVDYATTALSHPKAIAYSSAQSLAHSAPSLALGLAGGLAAGPLGAGAGAFAGSAAAEIGPWFLQGLEEKGFDTTNPEDIEKAFSDPETVRSLLRESERKGFATAGVDALLTMVGGKFLAGSKGAGVFSKVKALAKEGAVQVAGEGASEAAGQYAAKGEVDLADALNEGLTSLGSSAGRVAVGATSKSASNIKETFNELSPKLTQRLRDSFSKNPIKATEEIVTEFHNVSESEKQIEALQTIGDKVKELKDTKNAEGAIKNLVNTATSGEDSGSVFFQTDDWDKYWTAKGESPIVKAAELSPEAAKAYEEAKATGTDFEINAGEYIEKMAPTEHYDGLMQSIKPMSDGKNLNEIKKSHEELSAALKDVADEADAIIKKKDQSVKAVVKEQLKQVGFKEKDAGMQAAVYDALSNQMSKITGQTPLEFYSGLNLGINKITGKSSGDGLVINKTKKKDVTSLTTRPRIEFKVEDVNKLEGYAKEMADEMIDDAIKDMALEIESAEQGKRGGTTVDSGDEFKSINTSNKSTFPKWFQEIGVGSKKKFSAAIKKKSGADYEKIRAKAMDILVNGYESKQQGQVDPVNEFRNLMGMPNFQTPDDNSEFTLFQNGENQFGRIRIGDKEINIDLFDKANNSTFLHETGHLWLEVMGRVFDQVKNLDSKTSEQEQFIKDMNTSLEFLGVKSFSDIGTEQHELWARSVEKYFAEGKAPSTDLQAAFSRFKVWLVDVYKQLIYSKVPLSDDIRGVMDRLLASQEAIQEVESPRLFDEARMAGLSKEKAAAYEQARNEWREQAEAKLTQELMDDLKKKEAYNYKKEFKEWEEKEMQSLSEEKVYKSIAFIKDKSKGAGSPIGLNPATIDKKIVARMPKSILNKNGHDARMVAGLMGYENASAMAEDIANNPPIEEAARMNADAIMRQRYPDRLNEDDLKKHAQEIVDNDMKSKLLRTELDMMLNGDFTVFKDIAKASIRKMASNAEIKRQSEKTIAKKEVKNIKPYIFKNAEKKSARMAAESFGRGDFQATFDAKRKELLNYEMARASQDALNKIEKFYEKFDKINQKDEKIGKSRDINFIYAARAIMSKYELSNIDEDAVSPLEQLKIYDPMAWESIMALTQTIDIQAKPYDELTYDELTQVHDVVDSLWDLAKSSKEIEIDGKKFSKEQAKAELIFAIGENTKQEFRPGYAKAATKWEKTKVNLLGFKSSLKRVEHWASAMDRGAINGAFRKYIWNPISEASDKYRSDKTKYMVRFQKLTETISKSIEPTPIFANELGYEFKDKGELLGAMLHTGNESNLKKLLIGRGWGTQNQDGSLNMQKWQNFMNRMYRENVITKTEMDYIQAVWDLMEELKPDAQKAYKKLYGFYFNEITADEIKTPFGDYRGGYAPAVTDSFMVEDSKIREEQAAFEQVGNAFMFPATGKGWSENRVEGYNKPLVMDLRLFPQHLDKVLRFTHIQPKISEVSSLVMDRDFRDALYGMDPTIGSELLVPWLQRAAQQKVETPAQGRGWKGVASVAKVLRTNAGIQTMAVNLTNALQQFTGFSIVAVKVKPRFIRNAIWSYTRNSKNMSKDIAEKSLFMSERCGSQLFDAKSRIDEIILNPTKYEKSKEWLREHAYFLQSSFQGVVDNVAWQAAYDESVEQGMSEKEAVRRADSVVRETQGSFNAEDISEFESGNAFRRLFTMFYSYFNMQANLLGSEFSKTYQEVGLKKGAGRMLYVYMMGFMLPAVMSELIVRAMAGKFDQDDDDEYLDDAMAVFFGSQTRALTAMVPFVGSAINATLNTFNDKAYDDRVSTSPAIMMIESAVRAPKSVYDAIADDGSQKKAARDVLTLLGLMSGIPALPAAKPISYLSDVNEGDAQPTGPVDFTRGLITGKSGQ